MRIFPRMRYALALTTCSLLLTAALGAQTPARRRAVLVGIDDYSASRLPGPRDAKVDTRDWRDLKGAVRDVQTLRALLMLLYGFEERDIVTLTDQEATRAAILQAIDKHLVAPAAKGDSVFFYFAGHGSQVPNSRSDELDHLDESIIPADSRRGAPDIRDKELRTRFNAILDRGARLTLLLDHCYSGSSFRGLPTGARPRGIRPATLDVKDGTNYGPRPETRGALVLAATQDLDSAWEIRDEQGQFHGAFSWAFIRAIRDAATDESAQETFLRAHARMRAEIPYQDPLLAGSADARLRPFLGTRADRRTDRQRPIVAVEGVQPDGTVIVRGGWVNGLSVGSELRIVNDGVSSADSSADNDKDPASRLTITRLGIDRSTARMAGTRAMPQTVHSGSLLEVVGWAAPPGRPLRIWAPRTDGTAKSIAALARRIYADAQKRNLQWITDPLQDTPTHVLRPAANAWELLERNGASSTVSEAEIPAALIRIPRGSSLFVQFAAPSALLSEMAVGPDSKREGIEIVDSAQDADYILAGRYTASRLEFAWLRPLVRHDDAHKSGLPPQSAWILQNDRDATLRDSATSLRDALLKLRRIHGWYHLVSPPGPRPPYQLALQRESNGEIVKDGSLIGQEDYRVVLTPTGTRAVQSVPRFYYAFVIDSRGKSFLAFPQRATGSVENRFPLPAGDPTTPLRLGDNAVFSIREPYGVDTYFLLSTDEPLPNPSVLEWDGLRAPQWTEPLTALEQLFLLTIDPTRGARPLTTSQWSIEKVTFESVAPRTKR